MEYSDSWWGLLVVFLGGATPWLEAIVVIPGGIIAGLPAIPVVAAAVIGNVLTVALAAFAGEWLTARWSAFWQRRRAARHQELDPEVAARRAERAERRRRRVQKVMSRGGLPLLAILGPLGLGTQISALVAVGAGVRAWPAFLWISVATLVWGAVAAVLTVTGSELIRGA